MNPVGPVALPHVGEVHPSAHGVHDEAPGRAQARGEHPDVRDAVPVQARMADLAEATVGPIEPPPQGVDVNRLGLPNRIRVLDEELVLLFRAPVLPGDDEVIVVGEVHLRGPRRCVHCHAPAVVEVTAVEGQELLHNAAITRQARPFYPRIHLRPIQHVLLLTPPQRHRVHIAELDEVCDATPIQVSTPNHL